IRCARGEVWRSASRRWDSRLPSAWFRRTSLPPRPLALSQALRFSGAIPSLLPAFSRLWTADRILLRSFLLIAGERPAVTNPVTSNFRPLRLTWLLERLGRHPFEVSIRYTLALASPMVLSGIR